MTIEYRRGGQPCFPFVHRATTSLRTDEATRAALRRSHGGARLNCRRRRRQPASDECGDEPAGRSTGHCLLVAGRSMPPLQVCRGWTIDGRSADVEHWEPVSEEEEVHATMRAREPRGHRLGSHRLGIAVHICCRHGRRGGPTSRRSSVSAREGDAEMPMIFLMPDG